MKKCLLSLAVLLGAYTFASADTVTLNVNDAANFTGGTMTEERPAGTNSEKDTGEAKHYSPLSGFTIGDFTFGLTTTHATSDNAWYAAMSTNTNQQSNVRVYAKNATATMTITAPEGATMTAITAVQNQTVAGTDTTSPTLSASTGEVEFSGKNISWTGSANSVTVTVTGSKDYGNIRFTEFDITYDKAAAKEYTYTVSPAEGTVKEVNAITVTFDAPINGTVPGTGNIALTYNGSSKKNNPWSVTDGNSVTFYTGSGMLTNTTAWTDPGEYVFTVPAGKFALGDLTGDVYDMETGNSPEIVVKYTIEAATVKTPVDLASKLIQIAPDQESISEYWEDSMSVMLLLNGDWTLNTDCTASATMAKDGQVVYSLPAVAGETCNVGPYETGTSGVQLVFATTAPADGKYKMTIPEGFLTSAEGPNAEFTREWTVGNGGTVTPPTPNEYTYTADPVAGTYSSLGKVVVTFSAPVTGVSWAVMDNASLINTATNETVKTVSPEYILGSAEVTLDLRSAAAIPQPFTTPGTYELVLPAGKYGLDNKMTDEELDSNPGNSPEVRIRYTIEESATVTPIAFTVYEQNPARDEVNEGWKEQILSNTLVAGTWTINTDCTAKATMAKNGTVFSELAANDQNGYVTVQPMETGAEANLNGSSMIVLVFSPETGATEGEYTMVIPEGFLTSNGVPNAEYTYTWTVGTSKTVVNFADHLTQLYPNDSVEGMTAADMWGEGSYMVMAVLDGVVAVNPAATGTVTLKGNGKTIGVAISATASDDNLMIMPGDHYGTDVSAQADASVYTIGMTFLNSDDAPAPGDYVLSIPEGFFTLNGEELSAYSKTWTIKRVITGEYGTVPAESEELTTPVSDFDIIFPSATSVTLASGHTASEVTIVNGTNTISCIGSMRSELGLGTGISFFSINRTEALGDWTVTVPAGVLSVDGTVYDKEIKWTFKMVEPAKAELNIVPAAGEITPEQAMNIKLIYDGATSFEVAEEGTYMVMLEGKSASTGYINLMYVATVAADGIDLNLPAGAEVPEGDWMLNIYPNVFAVDGTWNEQITVNYTLKENGGTVTPPAELAKPASDPAEGTVENGSALDRIVLTLADGAEATAIGEADTYQVNLVPVVNGQDGISVRTYSVGIGDNANEIILTAEGNDLEPLTNGDYKLIITANTYFVGETGNSAYTFEYKVDSDSVEGIFADDSVFNAYTLTGICVIANGTAADVELLPAGLYIINGKKVLIRK